MWFKSAVFLIAVFVSANCSAGSTAQDWAKLTTPSQSLGFGQSIGSYTNGCISGASSLPLSGPGYQVMRLSRKRFYGHADLVTFIQHLGQAAVTEQLGSLLIGDLGQPRGGPTLSGHRSHQTGLDVDIWFLLSKEAQQRLLTPAERESWSAISMVNLKTDTLDQRLWSPNHEKILAIAAQQPEVDRIFVNPSIKQHLCRQYAAANSHWLRKIRPWWKHDDHFHVRLKCPANNLYCEKQEPLPTGNGCDAGLAWWFSAEAKTPAKSQPAPTPAPPLPALCEKLLAE